MKRLRKEVVMPRRKQSVLGVVFAFALGLTGASLLTFPGTATPEVNYARPIIVTVPAAATPVQAAQRLAPTATLNGLTPVSVCAGIPRVQATF